MSLWKIGLVTLPDSNVTLKMDLVPSTRPVFSLKMELVPGTRCISSVKMRLVPEENLFPPHLETKISSRDKFRDDWN